MDYPAIIKRIKTGDEKAFRTLYEELAPELYRFAYRYVKSDAIAAEIVQDTFVRLWSSRMRLDDSRDPRSYIFAIAYHQIIREFRQQLRNPLLRDYLEYAESMTEGEMSTVDYDTYIKAIQKAKKRLPPRQREIFEMNREQDLKPAEIASRLGISEQVVRNQLSAATRYIRSKLG